MTSLEERSLEAEISLKEADAALKREEIRTKSGPARSISSPITPLIITAVTGFLIAQYTSYLETKANLALEHEKLKSSLILKVIETGDNKVSANNLIALLDYGLIDDPGKIAALRQNPATAPVLPLPQGTVVPSTSKSLQQFFRQYVKEFGEVSPGTANNITQIMSFIGNDKAIHD